MKKAMTRLLLWLLTLLLLAAPVTALAADTDGTEKGNVSAEEEMMEQARDIFTRVAEQIRTQGTDLWEGFRAVISEIDVEELMTRLKNTFQGTRDLTDEQLREKIRTVAEETHLDLTDAQVDRLVKLCRQLEKLNIDDLRQKVEDWRSNTEKLEDIKDTAEDVGETAGEFFRSLTSFFRRVGDLVSDLLGG